MHIIKKKSSWLNKGLLARSIIATMQTYAFNDFSFDLYTYHDDLVYFNETPFKLLKHTTDSREPSKDRLRQQTLQRLWDEEQKNSAVSLIFVCFWMCFYWFCVMDGVILYSFLNLFLQVRVLDPTPGNVISLWEKMKIQLNNYKDRRFKLRY